ncbi:MAG TPA: protein kinase [Gemmatales bacterium]|nr:protein kinase [Gemmatales bacterium]
MTTATNTTHDPVDRLAEDFLTRYRRGERPSISEYARQFPDVANQVADVIQVMLLMENLGAEHDEASGSHHDPLPDKLGDYRIVRELGRGGMGVVYEAIQEELGRHVALKVLPATSLLKPNNLERFRREAKVAARLHHTNIVPVYGVGAQDGIHFYAMQDIQGQGLDTLLKEVKQQRSSTGSKDTLRNVAEATLHSTIPGYSSRHDYIQAVARIGKQIAEAVAHAHSQGVLHRDIKPSNILLDHEGNAWLSDFGLAQLDSSEKLTGTGDILGTLRYMAPERFKHQSDARSDIYSLGMTLYELLVLQPAYQEADRAKLIHQILKEEPLKPRSTDPSLPRDLETIVLKAITKEPEHRYQKAEELAEDLNRFLADRPVRARRVGLLGLAWRWARRNPALAIVTALFFVALLTGFAGIAGKSLEARRERDEAIGQRQRAEEHRRRAFAAIDRMLTRVGDKELSRIPQMEQKRRELLEDALGFYQQMLQEDSADPVTRHEFARAFVRVGSIHQWLGRRDQAEPAFRQGLAILEKLASEFPGQSQHRFELAMAQRAMGEFQADLGQSAEAEASLLTSISLLEALEKEQPAKCEYYRELAASHLALGGLYQRARQLTKAQSAFLRAVAIDEELSRAFPGDAGNRQALATSLGSLAAIYSKASRVGDAEVAFLRAIDLWDNVIRDDPENDAFLANCGAACQNLGLLYRELGRFDKAEDKYKRSLAICRQLVQLHPQVPFYRHRLAAAHQAAASLYRAMNRGTDAEAAYNNALDIAEPLARAYPEVPEYQVTLGITYNNLGLFHWRANDNDKAEAAYEKALATYAGLHQAYPDNLKYTANFASSCSNFADLLRSVGKLEPAIDKYAQAIVALEGVLKHEPGSSDARSFLFSAHWGRAMAWVTADRVDKAKVDWQRVVELSEGQGSITMRTYRPLPLAYIGDYQRAAREADTILAEAKVEPGVYQDYAGAFALASVAAGNDPLLPSNERELLRERFARRAMEMLARKKTAGRLVTFKQLGQLKTDRELESLRSRPDFQKFLAESEAEIKAKSP